MSPQAAPAGRGLPSPQRRIANKGDGPSTVFASRCARSNQERPPEPARLVGVAPGSSVRAPFPSTCEAPSMRHSTTVLGGVKDALAALGGCAALDAACAPWEPAIVDGVVKTSCGRVRLVDSARLGNGLEIRTHWRARSRTLAFASRRGTFPRRNLSHQSSWILLACHSGRSRALRHANG
jgi:hypothetical protein